MTHPPHISGPVRKPRSGGAPKQLVVLLHGWGADGANLIDLANMFMPALPDAQFVAPNAPFPCEANPFGYQWFSLMDRQPQHMLDGVNSAADIVSHFIDHELHHLGLTNDKVILIGFSQGTMTALHVALHRTPQIAAVVGFSGSLIAADMIASSIQARPPICLIHGEADDVVPFAALKQATDALKKSGIAAESHARPALGHSIDMEGITLAAEFLKRVVK